ncbi:MAG: DciA family protein [Pseudomonadota bacterium]
MRKIDTLLNQNSQHQHSQLGALTQQLQSHQLLQRFWAAVCPELLSQLSTVGSLTNGQLTIFAHSAIVANKIKLSQANFLSQLQQLQRTNHAFRDCKVTAISVKVQVKSQPKLVVPIPRKLSKQAAISLKKLAHDLGESPLAAKLNSLADKT